jgi:hypothetical protein
MHIEVLFKSRFCEYALNGSWTKALNFSEQADQKKKAAHVFQ